MHSAKKFLWAILFILPLFVLNAFGVVYDDYTPEVTARVVRISLLRGDVQIKRGGESQTWERATLNLPIVEGDEIVTERGARVEIQFDRDSFLRLAENSSLKFTTVRDEGVALSLPEGTLSLRVLIFDKSRSYFEIDAPSTTVSVEKAGMFRIDAGDARSSEMRVTATEGGEARVYSQNSGFTLRNGRSAKLFLNGNFAGEWETGDAARYVDEFDSWVLERDAVVAKRLRDSYYDKFYDRDIYGAEELNEYGEWIYTKKYGYVWRPYRNTTASYADWSPYRYGHWRWVPFYGWTWVNDEPWGWATYHHGRWVWDGGYWVWTPYANYRWRRSWWRPAMVSIVTWNGSVCWYPLSYYDNYYDYNSYYYRRNRNNIRIINNNTTIINNNTTVIVNPTPTPNPSNSPVPNATREERLERIQTPPLQRIPPTAVVMVSEKEFGQQTKGFKTAPLETGKTILGKVPDENQTPPILPEFKDMNGKVSKEILLETPKTPRADQVKTGATERKVGVSLDEDLRNQKIFGNRQPVTKTEQRRDDGGIIVNPNSETRKTGAVNRPVVKQDDSDPRTPQTTPNFPQNQRNTGGGNRENRDTRDSDTKNVRQKDRQEDQTPPIYIPPQPQTKPREERQPTFPQQRNENRREERQQPQPQPRPEPKNEPKSEPKSEPKNQPQPTEKPTVTNRKSDKDNR